MTQLTTPFVETTAGGLVILIVSLIVTGVVTDGGATVLPIAREILYFVLLLAVLIAGVSVPSHLGRDSAETASARKINREINDV